MGSPSLLLCDEPTGNLDTKSSAAIVELFERLNQEGLTLVVVTHNESIAERARRRVQIVDGQLSHLPAGNGVEQTGVELTADELGEQIMRSLGGHAETTLDAPDPAAPALTVASDAESATGSRPAPAKTAARSGMTARDLLEEALAGMFARPGRTVLTVLGVVIGITALIATLGLTRTAGNRIISQFDRMAATELFVSPRPGRETGSWT
jgi:energy-coupling factor transporter ATP-binding protein EcfA2